MNNLERAFRKRFLVLAGGGACVLMALAWGLVKGVFSRHDFALAGTIWWIVMFAAFYFLVRSHHVKMKEFRWQQITSGVPGQMIERDHCIRNIRTMKTFIVLFSILLLYGVVVSQGDSLRLRLAGAGLDVFILAACVWSLVRSQRKLRDIPNMEVEEFPKQD